MPVGVEDVLPVALALSLSPRLLCGAEDGCDIGLHFVRSETQNMDTGHGEGVVSELVGSSTVPMTSAVHFDRKADLGA